MMCVHCKALDAEACYIDNGTQKWVCSDKCLEGYLNEKRTQPKDAPGRTQEGRGRPVGEASVLHGLQQSGLKGGLRTLG